MKPAYTADIGLEVHAELHTHSKMFCTCPVLDLTEASPNTSVCPICAGLPGTLPTVNAQAVRMALLVALSLDCKIHPTSQFARKNYFYPDLPKGYQISQYEFPLAEGGILPVHTQDGWLSIRIRRVHLEEDTAKLTHIHQEDSNSYSLVDLNRAGIPLLEIVSEPDMHSVDQVLAYCRALRTLLRYLEVNSGDLEKGVMRFEANVSIRPLESSTLGTRVEIKNLNSLHAVTAAVGFELARQSALLDQGQEVSQETLGWDESNEITFAQRSKEEAHDYRYFPEPDLPPLVISASQINYLRDHLPERPDRRLQRYISDLELSHYQAERLTGDKAVADYFEAVLGHMPQPDPFLASNWIIGELFGLIHAEGSDIREISVPPGDFASLLNQIILGKVNLPTGKSILASMLNTGKDPEEIIHDAGLEQITDQEKLEEIVESVINAHPEEIAAYQHGKMALRSWFVGQVMQQTGGKANPAMVQKILEEKLPRA